MEKDIEWTGLKFSPDGKTILIVAGGRVWRSMGTFSNLDSVEVLDPTSHQGWTSGKIL